MLLNYVSELRNQDLLLDYSLLTDPFIQSGAMAMMVKGEISWYSSFLTAILQYPYTVNELGEVKVALHSSLPTFGFHLHMVGKQF